MLMSFTSLFLPPSLHLCHLSHFLPPSLPPSLPLRVRLSEHEAEVSDLETRLEKVRYDMTELSCYQLHTCTYPEDHTIPGRYACTCTWKNVYSTLAYETVREGYIYECHYGLPLWFNRYGSPCVYKAAGKLCVFPADES